MLPQFPRFENLKLSFRAEIEAITSRYEPYSDFNFISMWSWDTEGAIRVSRLNGNLVVRFIDYLSTDFFYSFIGTENVNDTAFTLLEFSKKEKLTSTLKFIPAVSVGELDRHRFLVSEDRAHFDYVYDIDKIKSYCGSGQKKHREVVRYFIKNYKYEVKELDLTQKSNQKSIINLVDLWIKQKKQKAPESLDINDYKNEYAALSRLLSAPIDLLGSVICFSVFIDNALCGFMIDQRTSERYCVSHFGKANLSYKGCMQFLMQRSAALFSGLGVRYYNDEQDLGLDNLRHAKSSYEPSYFLKKYCIDLL